MIFDKHSQQKEQTKKENCAFKFKKEIASILFYNLI